MFWFEDKINCFGKIVDLNINPNLRYLSFAAYEFDSYVIFKTVKDGTLEEVCEFSSKEYFEDSMKDRNIGIKW
jgi:hypothetical protein